MCARGLISRADYVRGADGYAGEQCSPLHYYTRRYHRKDYTMSNIRIIISGCCGHMGRTVANMVVADATAEIVAGFDIAADLSLGFPVFRDPVDFTGEADVIIDFSNPAALDALLGFAVYKKLPLVLCTTGYTPVQLAKIRDVSREIPVFRSGNMSLGINLLLELIKRATKVLGDGFDIEIVERHHRRKVDSPSGTALMLADAAASVKAPTPEYVYDRHPRSMPRPQNEIGISAVRGGSIVGDHTVIFAGTDEVIELRHSAYSRDVFAVGAVNAAKFMATVKTPGMYDMSDVLASK